MLYFKRLFLNVLAQSGNGAELVPLTRDTQKGIKRV